MAISDKEKKRILNSAAQIAREQRMKAKAAKRPSPEPDDPFMAKVEAHATKNHQDFNKSLQHFALEDPAGFGRHRQLVKEAMLSQAEKEQLARQLAAKLMGPQEFSTLRKLEEHIAMIQRVEPCDYPEALRLFSRDDPRSFGQYRRLKNQVLGN